MKSQAGFSLIELTLVVGILLLMSGLSAAFYARFLLQNAQDNTVSQIVEDLRKAQMYSLSGKGNSAWGVKYSNNLLTLYAVTGPTQETFSINPNITITGLGDIQFARVTGEIPSAATITVTQNNTAKTISITKKGVVSR